MSGQEWNFAEIEAGARLIQGAVLTTQGLLDEGQRSLATIAAAWEGPGSDVYQQVQRRWQEAAAELNASLRDLAQTITEASASMARTDSAVAGVFSSNNRRR